MYFHTGQDFVLNSKNIIGIFDLDTAGASRRTQDFFRSVEKNGAVVDLCAPGAVPRSFLVVEGDAVYLSSFSARALRHRIESAALAPQTGL